MVRGACIAVAVAAALGAHAADPEGFGAKQTITFSGYDGTTALENFPALIKLPTMNFRRIDYKDLVVTDADGNVLPHEVDSAMDGKVLVWVRIPSLSGTTTSVTAWFGKEEAPETDFTAADVWTNAYAAVWHMNTDAVDSTGHGLAQTVCEADKQSAVQSNGLLGRGFKLSGEDKSVVWLATPKSAFIDTCIADPNKITVSGWVKPANAVPGSAGRIFCWKSDTQKGGFDTFQNTNGKFYMRGADKNKSWTTAAPIPWTTNTWSHLVARFNETTFAAFCNGSEMAADSSSQTTTVNIDNGDNTKNLGFGNMGGSYEIKYPLKNAELDELRLYNGVASADWIKAEYRTVADSSFASYGAIIPLSDGDRDGTWTSGDASATWSAPANWANGTVASGYSSTVTFSSPSGTTEQSIDLAGAQVAVGSVVQNDAVDRSLADGTLAFREAADFDIANSAGRLALADDYSAFGLVKKGSGTLAFDQAFNIGGDVTVQGGTLALDGGAATEGYASGETSFMPTSLMRLTHVGIPVSSTPTARAYVRENGSLIAEMRFTPETPGFVRGGFRYLRLPECIFLSAGRTYTSTIYETGSSGEMPAGNILVAAADKMATVDGALYVAGVAGVSASSAVVKVNGLNVAGGFSAADASPAEIDATIVFPSTFSGSTTGPVGLIKRGADTLSLSGENLFEDGITCRDGMVEAATGSTLSPSAPLVFGDRTGSNKCGGFTVLADNAVVSNAISITCMTTTGLTDQGIYVQPGQTLTVRDTTVSDIDKKGPGSGSRVAGQFAVHAHADPDGAATRLIFRDSTVEYLDFTARIDGIADQLQARPSNEVVIDSVEAPNKIRKFVVQNSVPHSLGGTVTFAGAMPLVADWFDFVGNGVRVVQSPGSSLRVATDLRFNFFGQAITGTGVDWTIGNGATLMVNGFPTFVASDAVPTPSTLHFDGGTLKMGKSANDEVRLFNLDSQYELGVDVSANGGVIDLVPAGGGTANAVTIDRVISGAGAMTVKGDASLPVATLAADVTAAGGLVADSAKINLATDVLGASGISLTNGAELDVTSGVRRIAALACADGTSAKVSDGATLALALDNANGSFAGKVDVASGGTVRLAAGEIVDISLVSDGGFEVATVLSGGRGDCDKRSVRNADWLSEKLPGWTFGSDNNGSGVCVNGSYFSNNSQINENGVNNNYAAFLRKSGSVGPGLIEHTIETATDGLVVVVEFQYAARWYSDSGYGQSDGWTARVGVLFDGVQVYATETIHSTDENFKEWHTCTVEIPVAARGEHKLAFTAIDPDPDGAYAGDDPEALLDNVKVGVVAPIGGDRARQFGSLKLDLADGATLALDTTISKVQIASLTYNGQKIRGKVSAETCPFVTGKGSLSLGNGLLLLIR